MRAMLILLWVSSTVALQGCGVRQVYEGIQASQRMKCQRLPKSEYEECLDGVDQSYEEYRRNKEEVQKGQTE